MKKKSLLSIAAFLILCVTLVSCKGSKSIQGTWFAQNGDETNLEITIEEKKITINGDEYEYTQNYVGTKNGIKYYGIVQNDEVLSIIFPDKKNDSLAIMLMPYDTDNLLAGEMLFAMNKDEQPNYYEYAEQYLK